MIGPTGIHSKSRQAIYESFQSGDKTEASAAREDLIRVQKRELAIFRAIHKDLMRAKLPEMSQTFVDIGSTFTAPVSKERLFEMQGEQLLALEQLDILTDRSKGALSPDVKGEIYRLTHSLAGSILLNPAAKTLAGDGVKLEVLCKEVLTGRDVPLSKEGPGISGAVVQKAREQVAVELQNEKVLGAEVSLLAVAGVLVACKYLKRELDPD